PKFLAFATHYGFRPQACRVRRPQTKGKGERHFAYVESTLFNGGTFEKLAHRYRPGRLSPCRRRWLHHASKQSLFRTVLAHRPGPARTHHRERSHHLLGPPGGNHPASARAPHPDRRAATAQSPSSGG